MTLVLRKSFENFSAGTVVEQLTQPDKTRETISVVAYFTEVTYYRDFNAKQQQNRDRIRKIFDVPASLLVELRHRSDTVPAKTRKQRRLEQFKADTIIQELKDNA